MKRAKRGIATAAATAAVAVIVGVTVAATSSPSGGPPIRVGILHSETGSLAISEIPVIDSTRMAIDELNAHGGLLGRKIEVFQLDGRTDDAVFARDAEQLLTRDHVDVIFGCWSSACRKTLRPIVERHHNLLVYPVQYEGLEESPNILYVGAAPNQQIIPAVKWFLDNFGRRFFLVGSDYVFPRAANAIVKDYLKLYGGKVVGEEYVPLGGQDFTRVAREIKRARPDVILNTVNGASNIGLFRALRAAGIEAGRPPVVSFSIAEEEIQQIGAKLLAGNYAVWNYFQSERNARNQAFVRAFKERYGRSCMTDDPVEAGYTGVELWAEAVRAAHSPDPEQVLAKIGWMSYDAPEGMVYVDDENHHLWKQTRIGQILPSGQLAEVWESEGIIHPVPFPPTRTTAEWRDLLARLHARWHGWAAPAARGTTTAKETSCRLG